MTISIKIVNITERATFFAADMINEETLCGLHREWRDEALSLVQSKRPVKES